MAASSILTRSDPFHLAPTEGDSPAETLVYQLLGESLIHPEDWQRLAAGERERVFRSAEKAKALSMLVEMGLLTQYQVARISAGSTFGLVLGNYRILDRLGAGGMAVVFKAEHLEMRHVTAIKVLPMSPGQDPRLETRFTAEMRAVARLRHPNIVAALDAGRAFSPDPDAPVLWYLVMEYVPGLDLHDLVVGHGPLPVARSCNLIHQVASALAETHKVGLVHRDIKPSNVLVTPEDQAKLLDFGLSRRLDNRLTQPGTVLGTVDFMAPEQARDASTVDVRADIYSLGGTLFWCLTGELPFPTTGSATECLMRRLTQPPPALRACRPDLPAELEAVVRRMMALQPEARYSTPEAVLRALLPFLKPESRTRILLDKPASTPSALPGTSATRAQRILVVDDEPGIRQFCLDVLRGEGLVCDDAADGAAGLAACAAVPYDLVLLDIYMPGLSGRDVLRRLRENPPSANLKVILFSGQASADDLSQLLLAGADDYLSKPFSILQLLGRVKTALRLKDAQDRSDLLNAKLIDVNTQLERNLSARDSDLAHTRNALVLALARLVEHRESGVGRHLQRLQRYVRVLAGSAAEMPAFAGQISEAYVEMLACCAILHDIGKIGLPDHILLKPGKLAADERLLMQAHTTIGAETLEELTREHGSALAFLRMAVDIIRHHHERYDGNGYPDRLAGNAIPLCARIVAICDVYDALRSRRSYKPALSHGATLQLMTESSAGQFDPALLQAFTRCAAEFERIFDEMPG